MPDLKPHLDFLAGEPEPRGDGLAALRHIAPGKRDAVQTEDKDALGMAGLLALGFGFSITPPVTPGATR